MRDRGRDRGRAERKSKLDDEAAGGIVLGGAGAGMAADDGGGDGEAETGATGAAIACVGDAVEGAK